MSAMLAMRATGSQPALAWYARGLEDGTREARCLLEAQDPSFWRCVAYYSCAPATDAERAAYIEGFVFGATAEEQARATLEGGVS